MKKEYSESTAEKIWNQQDVPTQKHVWTIMLLTFFLAIMAILFLCLNTNLDSSRQMHAFEKHFIDINDVQIAFAQKRWFMRGNLEEIACVPNNQEIEKTQPQGPLCWIRSKNEGFIPEETKVIVLPPHLRSEPQDGFMIHINPDNKTYTVLVWPKNAKTTKNVENFVTYIENASTYIQAQHSTPSSIVVKSDKINDGSLPSNVVAPSDEELHLFYKIKS